MVEVQLNCVQYDGVAGGGGGGGSIYISFKETSEQWPYPMSY